MNLRSPRKKDLCSVSVPKILVHRRELARQRSFARLGAEEKGLISD